MADILSGIRQQLQRALAIKPSNGATLLPGFDTLGKLLDQPLRLLEQEPWGRLEQLDCGEGAPITDGMGTLLREISRQARTDQEALAALDSRLSEARLELDACYRAHRERQNQMLAEHLDDDDWETWLEPELDGDIVAPGERGEDDPADYPADDVEASLRLREAVWHIVAGVRAALKDQEHEGWILFELALLLAEQVERRHIQESRWAAQELERARTDGSPAEIILWEDFQRTHERRYRQWWRLFGPLHEWLSQRLELLPSGLDRVFDGIGDDLWELSLPELLDRARDLLV